MMGIQIEIEEVMMDNVPQVVQARVRWKLSTRSESVDKVALPTARFFFQLELLCTAKEHLRRQGALANSVRVVLES